MTCMDGTRTPPEVHCSASHRRILSSERPVLLSGIRVPRWWGEVPGLPV